MKWLWGAIVAVSTVVAAMVAFGNNLITMAQKMGFLLPPPTAVSVQPSSRPFPDSFHGLSPDAQVSILELVRTKALTPEQAKELASAMLGGVGSSLPSADNNYTITQADVDQLAASLLSGDPEAVSHLKMQLAMWGR